MERQFVGRYRQAPDNIFHSENDRASGQKQFLGKLKPLLTILFLDGELSRFRSKESSDFPPGGLLSHQVDASRSARQPAEYKGGRTHCQAHGAWLRHPRQGHHLHRGHEHQAHRPGRRRSEKGVPVARTAR